MPIEVVGREGSSGAWAKTTGGMHTGTLVRVEDMGPSQFDANKKRIRFVFSLEDQNDDEGQPIELHHYANLVLTPKSDIAKFLGQIGRPWEPGKSLDLETLVGTRCQFFVQIAQSPDGPRPVISKETFQPAVKSVPWESGKDVCEVKGCDAAVTHYTNGGKPLCAAHTGEDL